MKMIQIEQYDTDDKTSTSIILVLMVLALYTLCREFILNPAVLKFFSLIAYSPKSYLKVFHK